MFFILREAAGWLLVVVGLYLVWLSMDYVAARGVVEGSTVGFCGVMVLRGGIHLVKVSTAARICLAPRAASVDDRSRDGERAK